MDRLRAAIRHVRADYMPPAGDGAAGDGAAEDLLEAVYVFTRCRADEVGEDQALQEIVVAAIPPRAVHERMQKWAEFEAQFSVPLDLRRVETGRRATHDRLVAARAAGSPSSTWATRPSTPEAHRSRLAPCHRTSPGRRPTASW
ncbi:hypothetical protein [Tsukamurella soli]|uniref:hypothetical protein n=1 Tax=Tsukamurella soli TaxID=644556 RepID=UPI00361893A2